VLGVLLPGQQPLGEGGIVVPADQLTAAPPGKDAGKHHEGGEERAPAHRSST